MIQKLYLTILLLFFFFPAQAVEENVADNAYHLRKCQEYVKADDATQAEIYCRFSAEYGHPKAQALLGNLLANQNRVEAYMWMRLAMNDVQMRQIIKEEVERFKRTLTADEIAEATRRYSAWQPTNQLKKHELVY